MQNSTLTNFNNAILVLQYRNAPDQDTKLSPAMILFYKRPISNIQMTKI